MSSNYYTTKKPVGRARSATTLIAAAIGFMIGSALIIPMQGHSVIGPWALMILLTIAGAALGAIAAPLFAPLFKADSALRQESRGYRSYRSHDPVSGRTLRPNRQPAHTTI